MHSRRLASLLMGAWLAASIFMDFAAIQNFRGIDRFLGAPSAWAADQIRTMGGKAAARTLLRHEAGEVNRFLFEQWEYVQLALGIAVLAVLIFGRGDVPRAALFLTAFMLLIAAVDRVFLTPEITRLGRLLDYPNMPGADQRGFWRWHAAYSGAELLKLGFGFVAAGTVLIRRTDRKRFVRQHEKGPLRRAETAAPAPLP